MTKIVCLGWGSLIWNPQELPVDGGWREDGPELPLEFARQSQDKRITIVICEGIKPVKTLWATLTVPDVESAREALCEREGTVDSYIGWWSRTGTSGHLGSDNIGQWAKLRELDGVVWAALGPKIGSKCRMPTEEGVIEHLRNLDDHEREVAEMYIRYAPQQIVTEYRNAIQKQFGWTPAIKG